MALAPTMSRMITFNLFILKIIIGVEVAVSDGKVTMIDKSRIRL